MDKKELRLITWANDGYPPLDLSNELQAVLELIREVKRLRNRKDIKSVCEHLPTHFVIVTDEFVECKCGKKWRR